MFKTDKESLERLSFEFDEREVSLISKLLESLRQDNLSTLPQEEIARLQKGLAEIGRLKLEGKIYAFHVEDDYAYNQGGDAGCGVELYRRQGNTLKEFCVHFDRDWVFKVDQTLGALRKNKVRTLYTGDIDCGGNFLELHRESDPDDPIIRTRLEENEIAEYTQSGINVVVLDKLI